MRSESSCPPPVWNRSRPSFVLQVDSMSTERLLSIGEVAERAGRRTSAIRYYEEVGLLPRPVRVGGRRMYDAGVVGTLALIETAQRAGLTLEEIRLVRQGDVAALR